MRPPRWKPSLWERELYLTPTDGATIEPSKTFKRKQVKTKLPLREIKWKDLPNTDRFTPSPRGNNELASSFLAPEVSRSSETMFLSSLIVAVHHGDSDTAVAWSYDSDDGRKVHTITTWPGAESEVPFVSNIPHRDTAAGC